jgi:hypothetical protein
MGNLIGLSVPKDNGEFSSQRSGRIHTVIRRFNAYLDVILQRIAQVGLFVGASSDEKANGLGGVFFHNEDWERWG